ncbi:LADA_0F14972g1_1 [Lachancea dasiensis]|uniref:LADA_0F14972g1_1 n=1 Tax=Lachancea dasiensis TaxID=1072105 RepID=A0A1G4JNK1_9SACH|nr:LADA_0F14972g1_1 [Lachancea dasiensis]
MPTGAESFDSIDEFNDLDGNVKKRRKAIKQCLFCRKRKLKCDKKKPICTTCLSRGMKECVYVESFGPDISTEELLKSAPNLELLSKIKELEEELKLYKEGRRLHSGEGINPTRNIRVVLTKDDRKIYYGCTSLKAMLAISNLKFDTYHTIVWAKIKEERRRWKAISGYSTLKEVTAIEVKPESGLSYLDAMCRGLPFYEQIEESLRAFFSSSIYKGFEVLDPVVVFRNLENCFIKGPKDPITEMHPIVHLRPTFKKNFYPIGIITEIVSLVNYNQPISQPHDNFDRFLLSCFTAKVFFIERVQFIFLKRLAMITKGLTGGDHSNVSLITQSVFAAALQVGLHGNIKELFANDENSHGAIKYLENLWLWILYADIETATGLGTPPHIPEILMEYDLIEADNFGTNAILRRLIKPLRQILNGLHEKDKIPDLDAMSQQVKAILTSEFKPVVFYMDRENIKKVNFTELDLFLGLLSWLSILSNLKRTCFDDFTPVAINNTLQFSAQILSMSITITEGFFDLDRAAARENKAPPVRGIPYNLHLAMFILQKHFPRSIPEVYVLLSSISTFKGFDDLRFKYPLARKFDLPMDSLESVSDHYVGFQCTNEYFVKVLKRWESDENADMIRCLKCFSYGFIVICAIEKSSRDLFHHYFVNRLPICSGTDLSNPTVKEILFAQNETDRGDLGNYVEGLSEDVLNNLADDFWNNYETDLNSLLANDVDEMYTSWFSEANGRQ